MKVIFIRFIGYEVSWDSLRIINCKAVYKIAGSSATHMVIFWLLAS
jgi:hypothetical protein